MAHEAMYVIERSLCPNCFRDGAHVCGGANVGNRVTAGGTDIMDLCTCRKVKCKAEQKRAQKRYDKYYASRVR